jgi:hypothetical protein
MSDITNKLMKSSSSLAKRSKKLAQSGIKTGEKLLKQTVKGTQDLSDKLLSDISVSSKEIYNNISQGNLNKSLNNTGKLMKKSVDNVMDTFVKNKELNIIVKIIIAVYAAFMSQNIPKSIAYFFDNIIIKIFIALIIVIVASKDPSLSILISLSYILTLQTANKYRLIEKSNKELNLNSNEYFSEKSKSKSNLSSIDDIISDKESEEHHGENNEIPKINQNSMNNICPDSNILNEEINTLSSSHTTEPKPHHNNMNRHPLINDTSSSLDTQLNNLQVDNNDTNNSKYMLLEPNEIDPNKFIDNNFNKNDSLNNIDFQPLNIGNDNTCPQTFNNQFNTQGVTPDNLPQPYSGGQGYSNL